MNKKGLDSDSIEEEKRRRMYLREETLLFPFIFLSM
jgi:hypothetical protein